MIGTETRKAELLKQKLQNPKTWPDSPFLSVSREVEDRKKRQKTSRQYGTMFYLAEKGSVYLDVVLSPVASIKRIAKEDAKLLSQLKKETYNTYEEFINAGWEL